MRTLTDDEGCCAQNENIIQLFVNHMAEFSNVREEHRNLQNVLKRRVAASLCRGGEGETKTFNVQRKSYNN